MLNSKNFVDCQIERIHQFKLVNKSLAESEYLTNRDSRTIVNAERQCIDVHGLKNISWAQYLEVRRGPTLEPIGLTFLSFLWARAGRRLKNFKI